MPISPERLNARDQARRQVLVQAARDCFLKRGYADTSLDDIARAAGISRPLIYRKFKNKEELHAAVIESFFDGREPAVAQALAARGSKKEKLWRVYELLMLEPWRERTGAMAHELVERVAALHPDLAARQRRRLLKYTQAVLGAKEISELFMLAAAGLGADRPTAKLLRRRLELLVAQFAAN